MKQRDWWIGALVGLVFLVIGVVRPQHYQAETSIFVPLTLLEKQIEQNGIGFGSPSEIDAHVELMRSPRIEMLLKKRYGAQYVHLEVSKTRNGAVLIEATASDSEAAAGIANSAVELCDSLKQILLIQNVGQSHRFVQLSFRDAETEVNRLQSVLDSMRAIYDSTQVSLASEIYKYNGLFSAEVGALNVLKQRLNQLDHYLKAPAPQSYRIYPATPPENPAGIPAVVMGIATALLTYLALYTWRLYRSQRLK